MGSILHDTKVIVLLRNPVDRAFSNWRRQVQKNREALSFEAALAELEQIVRSLEQGQAPLDESIELYQRGDRLKRHCEARLKAAQARIEQIALGPDGEPKGTSPFDAA